jgi:ATP-dependent helicase/nuclease subunit B
VDYELHSEIDVWLRGGELVVAASERAARAIAAAFHCARRAEGLTAWPAPDVRDWRGFVRDAWQERSGDGRLVLNGLQERALWADVVGASGHGGALLEGPRLRMAALAMQAHELICAYAPRFLHAKARGGWQQDAAAFSGWLKEFDEACSVRNAMSAARLPLELLSALEADRSERPRLKVAGFDRLLPIQKTVLDAWGSWSAVDAGQRAEQFNIYALADAQAELQACALWCGRKLVENPRARLLVIAQDAGKRRGEIERAFLKIDGGHGAGPRFEFSLGVPLSAIGMVRGAYLLLRWLRGAIEEHEVDWLFSSGMTANGEAEMYALTGFMRALRRRGGQRTGWSLDALFAQHPGMELPRAWAMRMAQAKRRLEETGGGAQGPLAWAELVPELLEMSGWPGGRELASAEFQVLRRWQQTLDACASLGFDGRRMTWDGFLAELRRALDETVFAPESQDAPIQIAGPAESAGLTADAVWFMGATEDAWPASGLMHPLLPFEVQRSAGMPHGSVQLDWELAQAMTERLAASGTQVNFSYARQSAGVEARASRIVAGIAGEPRTLPEELIEPEVEEPATAIFEDASCVPLHGENAAGGAAVLTEQSQCPFKAFAKARLGAQRWDAAQAGLTAKQRGNLLHEVMHSVWGGAATAGIRTHAELVAIADLRAFVVGHVRRAVAETMPASAREQMPRRYLEIEEMRLVALVTAWLEFERLRVPFAVTETEVKKDVVVGGLRLELRLDRIDRLTDETVFVIDYKTGNVSAKMWELPRPEDVQLPLYAGFALDRETEPLGGLVFAKVRTGENEFVGRVGDAQGTLLASVKPRESLAKNALNAEELEGWRGYIEQLACDFIEGRADVDPREYPKTCEWCDLQAVCRVYENRALDGEDEEAGDE